MRLIASCRSQGLACTIRFLQVEFSEAASAVTYRRFAQLCAQGFGDVVEGPSERSESRQRCDWRVTAPCLRGSLLNFVSLVALKLSALLRTL